VAAAAIAIALFSSGCGDAGGEPSKPKSERTAGGWRLEREPAVEPWLRDVLGFVAARPEDPPGASRNYALVSVAMHDAVVAAWHWKYKYRRKAPRGDTLFDPAADPSKGIRCS